MEQGRSEYWVAFWGLDHDAMPYASVEKHSPKTHNHFSWFVLGKSIFPTKEEASSAALIGLAEEKAALVDAFDKVMAKLLAP